MLRFIFFSFFITAETASGKMIHISLIFIYVHLEEH